MTSAAAWTTLPEAFRERTARMVSREDHAAIEQTFLDPPLSVRWAGPDAEADMGAQVLVEHGMQPVPVGWYPGAWHIDTTHRRALSDLVADNTNRLFIQSLSSMAAVMAMGIQPGHDVLDLCAAPGAKTSLIHRQQRGRGILIANELSRNRMKRMAALLQRQCIESVEFVTGEGQRLGRSHAECFDRVLADVPCSGEGRFRAHEPRSWSNWSLERVRRLADRQIALLESACRTLRSGGEVLYATCTLAPEENERVVDAILASGDVPMEPVPLDLSCPSLRVPLASWEGQDFHEGVALGARIVAGEGMTPFFMARLRRR